MISSKLKLLVPLGTYIYATMEQNPKRRLIIRKKLVPKEQDTEESLLPPTTIPPTTTLPYGHNCTFYPLVETIKKKCPCGGEYTSDSEYTPRECCSDLYTTDRHYKWMDGRYTPDYIPVEDEKQLAKEKFYSGFTKPVVYDFSTDTEKTTPVSVELRGSTKVETKKTSGFSIMPASQLRETQRDSREDKRDSRNTSREDREYMRDYRDTPRETRRDIRETQRDNRDYRTKPREDWRDSRTTQRDDRDYRTKPREDRDTSRDYRETRRDNRDYREDWRNTPRDSREHQRDRDYHSTRDRDYERPRHRTDEPNSHNGSRREASKLKTGLDSELGAYSRKF